MIKYKVIFTSVSSTSDNISRYETRACTYIERSPVKQPVLFCDRKFDEGLRENKRNTYLHTSQSSRNDKSPLHWLCFLALAFRKMCSFVPDLSFRGPALSSQRVVERVKGGRVIRAEEKLCSSISGEKLPMNRWRGKRSRQRSRYKALFFILE